MGSGQHQLIRITCPHIEDEDNIAVHLWDQSIILEDTTDRHTRLLLCSACRGAVTGSILGEYVHEAMVKSISVSGGILKAISGDSISGIIAQLVSPVRGMGYRIMYSGENDQELTVAHPESGDCIDCIVHKDTNIFINDRGNMCNVPLHEAIRMVRRFVTETKTREANGE
jgi:hypothetical protein